MQSRNLAKHTLVAVVLGGLAFTSAAPAHAVAPSATAYAQARQDGRPAWADAALEAVNAARAQYDAAPVTWNDAVYPGAAEHAQSCKFEHGTAGGYGETIFATTRPGTAADVVRQAVQAWMAQAANYDPLKGGSNVGTGSFTQVVWKSTTQIAVGFAQCPPNTALKFPADSYYVVARFTPPGNISGQFWQNVGSHV